MSNTTTLLSGNEEVAVVVTLCVAVFAIALVVLICWCYHRRCKRKRFQEMVDLDGGTPGPTTIGRDTTDDDEEVLDFGAGTVEDDMSLPQEK